WFLVRWLDTGKRRDGLFVIALGALLWPIHLVYWPFYIVLVLYAALRLLRRESSVPIRHVLAALAIMTAALVPVASRALRLTHNAGEHVILGLPTLHHFEWTLHWKLPLTACAAAWLLARWRGWRRIERRPERTALVLVLAWWLVPPTCLFAYSYLTGNSVYVPRYFSISLPG